MKVVAVYRGADDDVQYLVDLDGRYGVVVSEHPEDRYVGSPQALAMILGRPGWKPAGDDAALIERARSYPGGKYLRPR